MLRRIASHGTIGGVSKTTQMTAIKIERTLMPHMMPRVQANTCSWLLPMALFSCLYLSLEAKILMVLMSSSENNCLSYSRFWVSNNFSLSLLSSICSNRDFS